MPEQQMSEEQMKELQEKIKNMSPEELREFQKKQCIFCHIISGKVQSRKVYEDDKCLAILDINPANPGHTLLLPKEHYSIMPQLSEEEIAHLFTVAKTISNASLRALEVQGTNIVVQNGIAAGQKAQHFMIHIIPRKEKDGVNFELPQKEIPEDELEAVRKQLEKKLGAVKEAPKLSNAPEGHKKSEAFFRESEKGLEMSEKQSFSEHTPKSKILDESKTFQKEKAKEVIKPKIVEAEFKETKKPSVSELLAKKNSKKLKNSQPKKSVKKNKLSKNEKGVGKTKFFQKPKKPKQAKEISLDDISRILGVK